MEIKGALAVLKEKLKGFTKGMKGSLVEESAFSRKLDLNFKTIKFLAILGIVIFVAVVFLLPTDVPVEFAEKIDRPPSNEAQSSSSTENSQRQESSQNLWSAPRMTMPSGSGGSQVNYNTSMIVGSKSGNAKTELRSGIRVPLRLMDKVIVSQDPVPILAESLLDSVSDSGLRLPAGTKFYGQASFQRGADRAQIRFDQISLPSGQIKRVSALALDKSGQPGVSGKVFSDGAKNTAGQVLTTFVGGLASGSMQTDIMGNSKGGIENGLLGAVAATAQSRAQAYGEKLKTEREWIELNPGTECDAVLNESFKLQEGGENDER
ncbi:MAG: TrbI/VirB10 family protein [Bdellovibrionaceae bacterium]|nr:TrbI/VirB10 family protein [Pseudobdellovibrionaceae bacterium]